MDVIRLSSFSNGNEGGNPAGVVFADEMPEVSAMQACAAEVGFSETAFAVPLNTSETSWRVRYFSPETEVPFCGHATIALGAALANRVGSGQFELQLNEATITVDGEKENGALSAALMSPPTHSKSLDADDIAATLQLFSLSEEQLDPALPPALIHGGANHYFLALKDRRDLAAMQYDLDAGRRFMHARDLITIMLVCRWDDKNFDVRNAFASGGVFEDPATGAAGAAFGGYLRDLDWPHHGSVSLIQGEDMCQPSRISVAIAPEMASPIRVAGTVYEME